MHLTNNLNLETIPYVSKEIARLRNLKNKSYSHILENIHSIQ